MNDERLLLLWGKTDRDNPGSNRYHPLLLHLLDVAYVALALWDHWMPERMQRRIANALGLALEDARITLAMLAGLHDLGKACPAFQRQAYPLFGLVGLPDTITTSVRRPLHGFVSTQELIERFEAGSIGWNTGAIEAYCLAAITGGHHGVFPTSELLRRTVYRAGEGREDSWKEARDLLVGRFLEHLPVSKDNVRPINISELCDGGIVPLLAGFISIADWIGSSQKHFPLAATIGLPPPDVKRYCSGLATRVRAALTDIGWLPRVCAAQQTSIGSVFNYITGFVPNRMQATVERIADAANGPNLIIVESGMGSGKTEAALYAFDRAFAGGIAHGLFVALPTMATGTAMFWRIRKYLEHRGHGPKAHMQLIHSNALLNDEFRALVFGAVYSEGNDPEMARSAPEAADEGTVSAEGWFTAKKRPLLAPFGAGTIDQSLLGVLQTRHWFVRLFGLAGKVIVFDEVHAYDAYMRTELKRLLRWLNALDCTVVLLSATLPSSTRAELLNAWNPHVDCSNLSAQYPRVTTVDGAGARDESVVETAERQKEIRLEFAAAEPKDLLRLVRRNLGEGGCGVILCNMVDRAQEAYGTLKAELAPEWRILLFHARMPLCWRQERETRVLDWLGKDGDRSRPTLIVGTQVLEQSLDYDADWMCSDIAPMDLLLQRMGRLWRHAFRTASGFRPTPFPVFTVLCENGVEGRLPAFKNAPNKVYARYLVQRTWVELTGKAAISIPGDIEPLVEAVYASSMPENLPAAVRDALEDSYRDMTASFREARKKAKRILVNEPADPEDLLESFNAELEDDEDPRTHETVQAATRDGEESMPVTCLGTAANGATLGTWESGEPDIEQTRMLMGYSLTIQNRALFWELLKRDAPKEWRRNSHLRFHRALRFDNGQNLDGLPLRIDPDEGLIIIREEP